jgi:hypothetical protein
MNDLLLMKAAKLKVFDGFNRADSLSLGNADTGQAWETLVAPLKILGNKCTGQSSGGNHGIIETGLLNKLVTVNMFLGSADINNVYARVLDQANYVRLRIDSASISIRKVISASETVLASYSYAWSGTHTLGIKTIDNIFTAYLDGLQILTVTDDNVAKTYTKSGITLYNAAAAPLSTFEDFKVEAI